MLTKKFTAAICIVSLAFASAQGADRQPVGSLGHPDKLVIEGATTFSREEIREAIFNELDVVAASAPAASLEPLLTVIGSRAAAGYRGAGFFDVDVSVVADDGKLVMTINEGQRFTNGEITVSGNHHIDAEKIKSQLTQPEKTDRKPRPAWPSDAPASFAPETEARLREKALTLVHEQGCYRAKLRAKIEPDRGAQQAVLHIDLHEEGPLSRLGDISLAGNERNSRDAVLAYLSLDATAPLTRELREQINARLLASGRFISVRWELGTPEDRGDAWSPGLHVKEYDLAPPLGQPLSREEAALLKAAEWFQRLEQSDEELVFLDGAGDNFLVLAPKRGFIAALKPLADDAEGEDGHEFDYAIVMDEKRVGLYCRSQRQKIVAEPPPAPVIGQAGVSIVGGAPDWNGREQTTFGAGFNTKTQKGYRRHMQLTLELAPTAALSLLYKHKAKHHWDGDVLSLAWDDRELRVNGLTGKLIEHLVKVESADGEPAAQTVRLFVMPGEFDRRRRQIENATAAWPNMADSHRPLSCLAEFLCHVMEQFHAYCRADAQRRIEEPAGDDDDPDASEFIREIKQQSNEAWREQEEKAERGYAAFRKAISRGMLTPFDRLLCNASESPHAGFSIPKPLFGFHARTLHECRSAALELAPLFGVRVGNFLFPVDGWMNAAWRKGLFAVANKPKALYLPSEIADQGGPLSSLATAELLKTAGDERQSILYALQGLRASSNTAAFREERRELVSREGFVSEVLLATAATMHQLEAADIAALVQLFVAFDVLDQPRAAALELALLRAHAQESPENAAETALDTLWRAGLSGWFERRARDLAGTSEEADR